MTDAGGPTTPFGVETIDLDLPPLVGALSRRLHEAGVPVTPGRSAEFARALTLVRPITRRRLYWTARAVLVSDPAQVKAFDAVFFSIFGDRLADDDFAPDDARTVAAPPDDRPRAEHERLRRDPGEQEPRAGGSWSAPGQSGDDEDAAEVEVPLALASDEELLGRKSFDALEPHELAQLYRLMSRLRARDPAAAHAPLREGAARRAHRPAAHAARQPAHRRATRSASRAAAGASRRGGSCCCATSPARWSRTPAPTCSSWRAPRGSGPNAEAFVFATRLTRLTRALASRNPERAIQRAAAAAPDWSSGTRIGDALRGVQRPPRPSRHGARRGDRDPLRRLGARRPDARRAARCSASRGWPIASCGSTRGSARAPSPSQAGGMVAALPYCDALVSGHSFQALGEVAEAIGAASWDDSPSARWQPRPADERRALGERHPAPGQLGRDAERARPEPGQHHAGLGDR